MRTNIQTFAGLAALLAILAHAPAGADDRVVSGDFGERWAWLSQNSRDLTDSAEEAVSEGFILVAGEGLAMPGGSEARQRMTAIRAAEVMAYRRLAEIINGVYVAGQTTVRECAVESDEVKTAVSGLVRGARKVHEVWNPKEGTAVVFMQIGMRGPDSVAEALYSSYINAEQGRTALRVAAYVPAAQPVAAAPLAAQPAPAPAPAPAEPHDGLIVDARELGFQPALINRIFSTKGEALYDPSRISQKILVEQGAGEYTNSIEKARAALEARGAKAPMVVKAVGLKTMADLHVSDEDVLRIFTADQKSNFLASAKVAFVLK